MFEKFRKVLTPKTGQKAKDSKLTPKAITAYIIFGAIILVFALFGVTPQQMGSDLGGAAATVNGEIISIASFRRRVEMIERNANLRMDQFPQEQREMFTKELRRRALEEMITSEAIFQSAKKMGMSVSDAEVRKTITSIPFFQDKGRFQRDRYESFLAASAQQSAGFEREIRKDLVTQKIQDLFISSNRISQTALDGIKALDQVEVSFKFAALDRGLLIAGFKATPKEIDQFLGDKTEDIRKEYERRKIEFQTKDRVKARHILVKISDTVTKEQAQKKALDISKELTTKNFADLAKKYSDDPGSKTQGGDLGFFERGRMVPAFEQAAFSMEEGKISAPIESEFGYHIILVEKKEAGGLKDLKSVEREIAQNLIGKAKIDSILAEMKEKVGKKDMASVRSLLGQLNIKWETAQNVSLGADSVPGLPQSSEALKVIALQKGQLGLIPSWNEWGGKAHLVDLTAWNSKPKTTPKDPKEGTPEQKLAGESFESWIMSLNDSIKVERNMRLFQ